MTSSQTVYKFLHPPSDIPVGHLMDTILTIFLSTKSTPKMKKIFILTLAILGSMVFLSFSSNHLETKYAKEESGCNCNNVITESDNKCTCGGDLFLSYTTCFNWVRCPLKCKNGWLYIGKTREKCTGCTPQQNGNGRGSVKEFYPCHVCKECGKKYVFN